MLLTRLVSTINWLSGAAFIVSMALVIGSALFVLATTLSRYLFSAPFEYTFELSGYMMLTMVFLALAHTVKAGRHIRVTFIVDRLPPHARGVVDLMMTILSLFWIVPFMVGCWYTWLYFFRENVLPSVGLDVPSWIPATSMIIGTVLLLLQVFVEIFKRIERLGRDEPSTMTDDASGAH